jgi:transcriptional regulator with XRE-family HTH domain
VSVWIGLRRGAAGRAQTTPGRFIGERVNPVVLGRKFCARCGHWRHVCDFRPCAHSVDGLFSYCHACKRSYEREYRGQMTEQQREARREYNRIRAEARRRAAGMRVYERHRPSVIDRVERVLLPRDPIVHELRRRRGELTTIALKSGVPERTITRLLSGESRRVRIDVADKLAVALGVPLATLYPSPEAEAMAA